MAQSGMTRTDKSLCYSITINAPREYAWEIRINPEYLPLYFKTSELSMKSFTGDVKQEGKARLVLEDEDGNEHVTLIRYLEIDPPHTFKEEVESSLNPGNKYLVRESFTGFSDKTKYLVSLMFEDNEDLFKLMEMGWHLSFQEIMANFAALMEKMMKEKSGVKGSPAP